MPALYILTDDRVAVPCDHVEWVNWFGDASRDGSRIVGNWQHKGVTISTVFLGVDHAWGGGPPMLFETMIFGGAHDQEQWRYSTWPEAEAAHMDLCRKLQAELDADTGATQ